MEICILSYAHAGYRFNIFAILKDFRRFFQLSMVSLHLLSLLLPQNNVNWRAVLSAGSDPTEVGKHSGVVRALACCHGRICSASDDGFIHVWPRDLDKEEPAAPSAEAVVRLGGDGKALWALTSWGGWLISGGEGKLIRVRPAPTRSRAKRGTRRHSCGAPSHTRRRDASTRLGGPAGAESHCPIGCAPARNNAVVSVRRARAPQRPAPIRPSARGTEAGTAHPIAPAPHPADTGRHDGRCGMWARGPAPGNWTATPTTCAP